MFRDCSCVHPGSKIMPRSTPPFSSSVSDRLAANGDECCIFSSEQKTRVSVLDLTSDYAYILSDLNLIHTVYTI